MTHTGRALVVVLASAAAATAQEDYRHGRIRDVEATVSLQREAEPGAEEAYPNSPFLPGDRVWTDARGRVEFQFPDGAVLRLDSRGKLDYLTHDEARGEKVVLKLWSGGLYLRTRGDRGGSAMEIETPAGLVEANDRGTYRIDVEAGETRLSVYEGAATLDGGGRRVDVDAGERAYVRRGEDPERPRTFDRGYEDDFAAWDRGRQSREAFVDGGRQYLPEELDAYSGELEANGAWRYEASVGYVWQPYVEVGWSPYTRGRWSWTSYGWTWIPAERWGWAPFHYGRWGQSASFGWYWIPGRSWGPAWVSWASGGDYVGWCPLGYRDRPVYGWGATGGVAVSRGGGRNAWNFVHRGDLGARDLARRRVDASLADLQQVRVVESPRARPSRDVRAFGLGETGGRAVPRGARIGPTPGDTVPELRVDRLTLPLGAGPRPRYNERDGAAGRGAERRTSREAPQGDRLQAGERATDVRSPRIRPTSDRDGGASGAEVRRTDPRHSEPQRLTPTERDADHDVLGRFFRPLSEPRARSRSDEDRERTPPPTAPREDRYRPRREEARPRNDASEGRSRGDGESRGARSAPREERTPPPRVEPRRTEPARSAPRPERTEHAAPRPPRQESRKH